MQRPVAGPQEAGLTLPTGLETPRAIQTFLDSIAYSADPIYRCPRRVIEDGKAHCFDGALFGAAALRRLGYPLLILEMLAEPTRDDPHLLALFKEDGWGADPESNFVGLRFREPIHRTLREPSSPTSRTSTTTPARRPSAATPGRSPCGPSTASAGRRTTSRRHRRSPGRDRPRQPPHPPPGGAALPARQRAHQAGMLGLDRAGLYRAPAKE